MKTYKVTPAEVIGLEFEDGHTIALKFNTRAMEYLGEVISDRGISPSDLAYFNAAIIYAGVKTCDPNFTFEEAENLFVQLQEMQPSALNGVLNAYFESTGVDPEKFVKKNMNQLSRIMSEMKKEN